MSDRIDLHAHFLPPAYRSACEAAGHAQPDGFPTLPQWSAAEHVDVMDRLRIAKSYLSISSPGVHFGDDTAARGLAREVNDAGHDARQQHAGRFGLLASLPLPDIDGTMAEIAYAFDTLHADGVALLTNVNGTYLGDASYEPVFAALNDRHARVFIHPSSPACHEATSFGRPRPMLEFIFDTTRAVVNLVLNGVVARYPNIEFIVPHAGAALPSIADRIAAFSMILPDADPSADVMRDIGRLHYDLAGFPLPRQLDALLAIATREHLHYGSDWPFTPEFVVESLTAALDAADLTTTLRDNTRRLFDHGASS